MAPTIQTQPQREDGHRPSSHRTVPERSGVVCRVKYCNSLPDIPFDPKFITYPFDQHRFVQYKATSLEKQHKHELLTEPDLGVTIDLINPDTYRVDPNSKCLCASFLLTKFTCQSFVKNLNSYFCCRLQKQHRPLA
ncbi:RNA polymerase II-associated factor 1 homolog [Entelurus aequoreus]|uniref:RNA polymerase II-associated factor 1 homolog n=1 Tax=Entelurus aequoreus TaxID=161455 RepID=UPI002B1DDCAB|nr:RNA polymerase II-associated factor 1 homolog [Entelurus aequoreus]